jgi:hypothetical protein
MPAPQAVYPVVVRWIEVVVGPSQPWATAALARLVLALLCAQRLTAASLLRASLSDTLVPARQGYKRLARALARPWLTPAFLTPRLVRAALALTAAVHPVLALDSVRLGRWEVFTIGLVWHSRVLVVGWAVLPYPWPKGAFTPTVRTLLEQVAAAWPADRAAPELVADRGFPGKRLFATLARLGWRFTVRLRATDVVVVGGVRQPVRARLEQATAGTFTAVAATYGSGRQATTGTLVVGRGLPVLAWHQRDDGSARARRKQARRRDHHVATKRGRGEHRTAPASDRWLVLFTTHARWHPALRSYRQRWATEGSYRDVQSGWDGWSGWDLGGTVARLRDGEAVARVVGLWALGLLLQTWVGDQAGRAVDPTVRATLASWTTTGRLSVWARGRLAFLDPSARLQRWLCDTLDTGAARISAARPLPDTIRRFAPRARPPGRNAKAA